MTVTIFKVRSNLSRQIRSPGGQTISAAAARSTLALESQRDKIMESIGEALADVERIAKEKKPTSCHEVYPAAVRLLDLSGYLDTGPLYAAIYSLCELSDRMTNENWNWASVDVHCRAMRLIHAHGCVNDEMSIALLEGLSSILDRIDKPAI